VFLDCLHFDPPFFVSLGALTGMDSYVNIGLEQAAGYVRLLQGDSGLFDHFVLQGDVTKYGPGWGRGQGWAILGLLDVLEATQNLDLDDRSRETVEGLKISLSGLISAMATLQRSDGHWYAVVDRDDSGDEYSTAAFMACGFSRARRMGLIEDDIVHASIDRARDAVLNGLSRDGKLDNVSAAVMACTQASHYRYVPSNFLVPWGQGPAVSTLTESLHER
jgi:unsaturated rhamnogalacturonyl hydrolase